jgi:hypothetical protein
MRKEERQSKTQELKRTQNLSLSLSLKSLRVCDEFGTRRGFDLLNCV